MRRREFFALPAAAVASAQDAPTKFQVACMTLPYSAFPLERALKGIRDAGYRYVAWGTTHVDASGAKKPVLDVEAPPKEAARLGEQGRALGLEAVMMFSGVNFEDRNAVEVYRKRIEQAKAAGIGHIIVFGKTTAGDYNSVIRNLQAAAKHAEGTDVLLSLKQHGGNTATGADCSRIIADVGHPSVKMCYDAGNVLDYENHDPIPDIQKCWRDIRSFALKDHRNFPKDEDCGIGFGEIDHYKLFAPVMRTGLTMPIAAENISEPLVPRPQTPEGVDRLARRSREFVEAVLAGLANHSQIKP